MRKLSILAAVLVLSCAGPKSIPYPVRDPSGNLIEPEPDSCFASEAARRYMYGVRESVLEVWRPPPHAPPGEWQVAIDLRIDALGNVKLAHPLEASNPMNDSALAALHEAAPFGVVPAEALCLAEQPFAATFSVQVR